MKENLSMPNPRHLRVFDVVARIQSVSRASAAVHLSQPAISQAIANLEEYFGVRLLERHQMGSMPSQYGEILLFRIRRMHQQMLHAIQEFAATAASAPKIDAETVVAKITLPQIRSLIAVSQNISFERASRSIGISQPSLHKAARDLEKLMRATLYVRGAHGTTTNHEAGVLARRLNVALGEIRYAREEIDHGKGLVSASLLVGTLSTSGAPLLARAIDTISAKYPGIQVNVIEEPYEHLLNDLLLGKIDFVFSVLRRPDWAIEVTEETLYRDDYVVVCRPGHPLNGSREITLRDLSSFSWVIPGTSTPRYKAFKSLFDKHTLPTAKIVTTSRAITQALIARSDRLTILTRQEALSEQALGVMSVLPFRCQIPAPAYGVATRTQWAPTTSQQQFLEILRQLGSEVTALLQHRVSANRRPAAATRTA